jgi:hypothetical protein
MTNFDLILFEEKRYQRNGFSLVGQANDEAEQLCIQETRNKLQTKKNRRKRRFLISQRCD